MILLFYSLPLIMPLRLDLAVINAITTEKIKDKAVTTSNIDWTTMLNKLYPVGSIYQSTNHTNPSTFLGGTWIEIEFISIGSYSVTGGMNISSGAVPGHNILQIYKSFSGDDNEKFYLMKMNKAKIYLYERTA